MGDLSHRVSWIDLSFRQCAPDRTSGIHGPVEPRMIDLLRRFARDESGATAIEYGLIAAGISVAIITVVNRLGSQLKSTFTIISSNLTTAGK
jgi:pilus assembly protein Flp/PilA